MTETCSGISGFWLNNHIDKCSSAGKPFSNVDISIINNNVSIASDMNMKGYYQERGKEVIVLKKGDIIIEIGGKDIKNIYDYMYRLGELNPGQNINIKVRRGDIIIDLKVNL